ncbi:MAG: hypothetical protein JKY98_04170 [Gammaproteobacteria bacterium]|nr:hypothetical protein [Gammaproteobacteria bacterium]
MIELEYLRDWVYGPVLAVITLLASFFWHKMAKDRKELKEEIKEQKEEIKILREDHSLTKKNVAEQKVCIGRIDELVKGLEK